jgi:hypothetical protein
MNRYILTSAAVLGLMSGAAFGQTSQYSAPPPPPYGSVAPSGPYGAPPAPGAGYSTTVQTRSTDYNGNPVITKQTYKSDLNGSSETRTQTGTDPVTGATVTHSTTITPPQ